MKYFTKATNMMSRNFRMAYYKTLALKNKLFHSSIILIFLLLQGNMPGIAQSATISGTVYNSLSGKPISGITVKIQGVDQAAKTSASGEYILNVPDTLQAIVFEQFAEMEISEIKNVSEGVIDIYLTNKRFEDLTLDELLNVKVKSVSNKLESISDAPATIIVISKEDIRKRGYTDLGEVLTDLPGFDVMITNGVNYLMAYQRGYRTNFTERTLLMINGKVENNLYTQSAEISRQYSLTNVERIEVLYGPVSAVYGPNAFLGIINIVTKDAANLPVNSIETTTSLILGDYKTKGADLNILGKMDDLSFSITARVFNSDEVDLSGKFGFINNSFYGNKTIWGPILNLENSSKKLGSYYDPTHDYGLSSEIAYKGLKAGISVWKISEAYGPYYAADRVQNNNFWDKSALQLFIETNSELQENITGTTQFIYRTNEITGNWTEAVPDQGDEKYSFISFTSWASRNKSWLAKQDFNIELEENFSLQAGLKYELKELTKNYDIPGYWHAYSSAGSDTTLLGIGIGHSTDPVYYIPPVPSSVMPYDNLIYTTDAGVFIQAIYTFGNFHFNTGFRYDDNSVYGHSVNPRLSVIYNPNENTSCKLVYGEAFQEPSPVLLWGGWNGRNSTPDLKPEKARNLELIALFTRSKIVAEFSAYYSMYENVNQPGAPAGKRNIYGFEPRFRFNVQNLFPRSKNITAYLYYTYTHTYSSISYIQALNKWEENEGEIGDIAPHKIQFGIDIPLFDFNINIRNNYISERKLYSHNPLSASDYKIGSFLLTNMVIGYNIQLLSVGLKINNLFNTQYLIPGCEGADAGIDFTNRSKGFNNSLIPTPDRNFSMYFSLKL